MGKNAIVGQSGGPTSVINASLAGVFESCKSRGAEIVYGMCNGVAGLLEERVVDLSTVLTDDLDIELLKRCLLYTSPSPRDRTRSRMPSSA